MLLSALTEIVDVYDDILSDLNIAIRRQIESRQTFVILEFERSSGRGRPRFTISVDALTLVEMGLPLNIIARLLGVSRTTVYRRMKEQNPSLRASYSSCSDNELDSLITEIKNTMPDAGYRVVRGAFLAQGHKIQWDRLHASLRLQADWPWMCGQKNIQCSLSKVFGAH